MVFTIYKRVAAVLKKKPLVLWGISLLAVLLDCLAWTFFGAVIGVALAVSLLLSASVVMVLLAGYRGDEIHCLDLFASFKDWKTIKRVLCGMGWMELWILIWGLIPGAGIVFAIMKVYEYRLTPYILMQNPDVKPTDAIKLSSEMTKGYRGKMFAADLLILAAIGVGSLVLSLLGGLVGLAGVPYIGWLFVLLGVTFIMACVAFSVVTAAFAPLFLGLVQAAFYEQITNPEQRAALPEAAPVAPIVLGEAVPEAPAAESEPMPQAPAAEPEPVAEPEPIAPSEPAPQAPAAPVVAQAAFCPQCGSKLPPDSAFCPNCGTKI